ncbi:unnamed protein product [Prunus brigantina]
MMASRAPRRAVGINAKSSATHATTIGGCETSVARRVRSSRIEGSKKLLGSGSAFNATPGRAGLPAEFKHINKRRKRNLQGFPYRQNGSVTSGKGLAARGWARGSRSRTRRLSVDCSSCSRGESGSPRAGRGGRTGARNPG